MRYRVFLIFFLILGLPLLALGQVVADSVWELDFLPTHLVSTPAAKALTLGPISNFTFR